MAKNERISRKKGCFAGPNKYVRCTYYICKGIAKGLEYMNNTCFDSCSAYWGMSFTGHRAR